MLDPTPFFTKKLLLVTGKGGIGKSLVTAALGQLAAERGLRTLLVENASQDQLGPLFGLPALGHQESQIQPQLSCLNIGSEENFREYVVKYLGQRMLYETVFSNRLVKSFMSTVPGLAEVMLLGRLFYIAELKEGERPDLVVFDAPASGHFMSLMTTPDAVLKSSLGGPLVRETERVNGFLASPDKCAVLYVTVPEDLVVSEALEFLPRLAAASPARLGGVVVNRVPAPDPVLDELALQHPTPVSIYLEERRAAAREALQTLRLGLDELARGSAALALATLPELGFIDEPLGRGFGERFLAGRGPAGGEV